jgi:hypothetical protein
MSGTCLRHCILPRHQLLLIQVACSTLQVIWCSHWASHFRKVLFVVSVVFGKVVEGLPRIRLQGWLGCLYSPPYTLCPLSLFSFFFLLHHRLTLSYFDTSLQAHFDVGPHYLSLVCKLRLLKKRLVTKKHPSSFASSLLLDPFFLSIDIDTASQAARPLYNDLDRRPKDNSARCSSFFVP